MGDAVIEVDGLRKSYNGVEAVAGIDLNVERGEVFGFLGPNGAGKTTTIEILEGYRSRDAGKVSILGCDPARPTHQWRSRIGFVLQTCRVEPQLTVRETVALYGSCYPSPRDVDETVDLVGLGEFPDKRSSKLSGGQQRRLDVALALIGDPELVFLDEPTTGFDPSARREAWHMIEGLRDLGKTVMLTTHYMDEAQNLADRVAIIARGKIVAEGSPDEIGRGGGDSYTIGFKKPGGVSEQQLRAAIGVEFKLDSDQIVIVTERPEPILNSLTGWAIGEGHNLHSLSVGRPSLEDIYLELTKEAGK